MNWDISKHDRDIITQIVDRAATVAKSIGIDYDRQSIEMDITATHLNGTPLRLQELADANAWDFWHDIFGIRQHLNRSTGKLVDFCPRYAAE